MESNEFLSTLLGDDSVKSISKATGSNQQDVEKVLVAALPSLLGGALGQAQDEQTAEGFAGALADHAKVDTRDLGSFMSNVDMEDGGKILTHLLGSNATATAQDVATRSGMDLGSTIKILAVAAPLLMSLLGQHNQQAQPAASGVSPVVSLLGGLLGAGQPQQQSGLGGGLLGSLLGVSQPQQQSSLGTGLLGSLLGVSQPQQQQQSGLGAGLLGSLLGGGQSQQQQQSGLGAGLLGSLLGGGQPQQQQQSGLGADLLGSLLGVNQTAQTTTTTGKKKKKKPAASANAELLSLGNTPAQSQSQQTPGLMDILMGLLK